MSRGKEAMTSATPIDLPNEADPVAIASATPIDLPNEADPVAIATAPPRKELRRLRRRACSLAIAKEQKGRALLEVVVVGLLLLVPVVWVLTVLSELHRAGLAVAAAVHAAATDAARSPSRETAARAVEAGAAGALEDHGIDPRTAEVSFSASPGLRRGGEVIVRVAVPVRVARAPFLGALTGPSLWVRATGGRRLDLYRSRE